MEEAKAINEIFVKHGVEQIPIHSKNWLPKLLSCIQALSSKIDEYNRLQDRLSAIAKCPDLNCDGCKQVAKGVYNDRA